MEPITTFADWVRQRRKALDLTQTALAEQIGYSVVTIKKIEQEMRRPSRELAERLAEHLAIPVTERDTFMRLARGEYVETTIFAADATPTPAFLQATDEDTGPSQFVSREQELARLETHLVAALNGSGRTVFVTGEAGRGKTTLMTEFARRAQERYSDLVVASGNCDAYAGTGDPYLPFRDVMALFAGDVEAKWQAGVLRREQARRLWALLPQTVQALLDHGPDLLGVFVSSATLVQRARASATHEANPDWMRLQAHLEWQHTQPGSLRQRQLFEQYTQVLCTLATRHPLLLVLDDLHWIDNGSAGLLFHLGRRLSNSRLLILAAYRPSEVTLPSFASFQSDAGEPAGVHPLIPVVHELTRRYGDIVIDLGRLDAQADRAFVDALLDREPHRLSNSFRSALFRRTRGHPLFTVELLRDLQARRALVRDETSCWVERAPVDWEALPSRIEAVLARRINHLPLRLQEVLKIASVQGETFIAEAVARVLEVDKQDMVRQLSGVVDRQHHLVRSQSNERRGQQVLSHYRFRHILFQNYLYETLDAAERVYLHEAVGRALEGLYAEQTADAAVQLAHHFRMAGLTTKAVEYLLEAGERAVRLSAHSEAILHLSRGLALVEDLLDTVTRPQQELRFQIALGISLAVAKGWAAPDAGRAYARARVLAQQHAEPFQLGSILWGLYVFYVVQGRLRTAYELGEQCLSLTQDQEDAPLLVIGHFMMGVPSFHLGKLSVAQAHLEQGRTSYTPDEHHIYVARYGTDFGVFSTVYEAHILWYLGYPDRALQHIQSALAMAQKLDHPYSLAVAQGYATMLHQLRRDWRATQAWAEATLALCAKYDFPYYAAWAILLQGWAMAEQGKIEEGLAQMQEGLADLRAMETGLRETYYLGLLAEANARVGHVEEGLRLVDQALALVHEHDERLHEAELYRLQGELFNLQGEADRRGEECFLHALDVAHRQDAKSLELRAVMGLSRFWQREGNAATAQQQLAAIYNRFTEGFDTLDLQEAKALLDELSQV